MKEHILVRDNEFAIVVPLSKDIMGKTGFRLTDPALKQKFKAVLYSILLSTLADEGIVHE